MFTGGAVSTQRNEGINKHCKAGLSKSGDLAKVINEVNARIDYQEDRSLFQSTLQETDYKRMATSAQESFKHAYAAMQLVCSDFGRGLFNKQAGMIVHYKVVGQLHGACPEDSPEEVWNWAATTTFDAVTTLDKCDAFRSSSVKEFIHKHVSDADYVCYALQRQEAALNKAAPQIVVLYDKDQTSSEHAQYLKFFCTCGFSTR